MCEAGILARLNARLAAERELHALAQEVLGLVLSLRAERCVEVALREFPNLSSRAIAEMCGVSNVFVTQQRGEVLTVNTSPVTGADGKRYRSARRCGEMLRATAASGERHRGHGDQKSGSHDATPTLADLGLTKSQSSRYQALAAMPEEAARDA